MATRDTVAITGSILGLLASALGWFTLKSSRVAAGVSLRLWDGVGWGGAAVLLALWTACLIAALTPKGRKPAAVLGLAANLVLVITFIFTGFAASQLLGEGSPVARVSPGAGFWLTCAAAYIIIFASRQRFSDARMLLNLVSWSGLVAVAILLASGWMNNVSIVQEFTGNRERFSQELLNHLLLFGGSAALGAVIGIPLGLWAAGSRHAEGPVFLIANITQTIPSLVLFGLLIAPLSALSFAFPELRQLGIRGVGAAPAMIALVIYSLLPIVRNTFVGLRQIDTAVIDAGFGMGMSRFQVFRRLQMPLAAPLVLEGVRTASVQGVGNAAVAALIGAGGLGWFVFQGLGQAAPDLIILGAIPIIGLALVVDVVMRSIVRLATPKGLAQDNR